MNIWLINHYAVPPQYYPLARQTNFAKFLMKKGHTVKIFAASTVHNSNINLITGKESFREDVIDGVTYVYIKCRDYQGNGLKRIYNMVEFALKLPMICKKFDKPDVIVSTSVPPTSCAVGVWLAKKWKCKAIAEIADLWPESIVDLGYASRYNPIIQMLYCLEKWIYTKSDAVVFTMEGGKDYIVSKKWDTEHGGKINLDKIYNINNGIILEQFENEKENYIVKDSDLDNKDIFKVSYSGSIRKANNVDILLEASKLIKLPNIKILIWGAGDELSRLQERIKKENIENVVLKGKVEKKYIPNIVSRTDLNVLTLEKSPLFKYGLSSNKSFEYLAAGKPILLVVNAGYSLTQKYNCGGQVSSGDAEEVARQIEYFAQLPTDKFEMYCKNSKRAAAEYDFENLTDKLINIITDIDKKYN